MLKKYLLLTLSLLLVGSLVACGGGLSTNSLGNEDSGLVSHGGSSNANLKAQIQNLETLADTVTFGTDTGTKEPIEWYVLEDDGSKALLLSKYLLEGRGYNDEYKDITWENCTLRKWLNSDFMKLTFSKKEQNSILTIDVINSDNERCGTKGGNNTNDKIFLLSIDEFKKYFPKGSEATYKNGANRMWWLRSPGNHQYDAAAVNFDGDLNVFYNDTVINSFIGVRPALWVKY